MTHNIADVKIIAEQLRWAKDKGYSTAVLLGAGMSVSAGIPAANGVIKEIEKEFPKLCAKCSDETYSAYMKLLPPAHRKHLIGNFIDNAKINLAHLYLGALVKEGYVDRILTTNFDPLVARSLALYNIYPAIYDIAASQSFIAEDVAQLSLFYLHGQRDGFVLLNTKEEVNKHSEKLGDVFEDANRGRCWLVIGYSGDNDPVFNRLAEISEFRHNLYWIGYKDNEPDKHILENILQPKDKCGKFVNGYDADSFFLELAKELELPEPQIISKPFSHLKEAISTIAEYQIEDKLADMTKETRMWVDTAIEGFEEGKGFEHIAGASKKEIDEDELIRKTRDIWIHARFNEIDDFIENVKSTNVPEAKQNIANALNHWGCYLGELARTKEGEEADKRFEKAFENYENALEIKPNMYDVLNNWGIYLGEFARTKEGAEADKRFEKAFEKFENALEINPDMHEALNSWGNGLGELAKRKEGAEADKLFEKAFEKYENALEIKPDKHEALYGWGYYLGELAKRKEGEEADKLFEKALEVLMKAEKIKKGAGAYNLACIYSLKGNDKESLRWLKTGLKMKPTTSRSHILSDTDLDNIKETDEFNRILDEYRPE